MASQVRLPFEKDIYALEDLLASLEAREGTEISQGEEIRRIRKEIANLKKSIFGNLSPWETVLVSRHPDRPQMMDYVDLIFEDFVNCSETGLLAMTGLCELALPVWRNFGSCWLGIKKAIPFRKEGNACMVAPILKDTEKPLKI